MGELLPLALKCGAVNLAAMAALEDVTSPPAASSSLLQVLVDSYGIRPISTPEADLAQIMG